MLLVFDIECPRPRRRPEPGDRVDRRPQERAAWHVAITICGPPRRARLASSSSGDKTTGESSTSSSSLSHQSQYYTDCSSPSPEA